MISLHSPVFPHVLAHTLKLAMLSLWSHILYQWSHSMWILYKFSMNLWDRPRQRQTEKGRRHICICLLLHLWVPQGTPWNSPFSNFLCTSTLHCLILFISVCEYKLSHCRCSLKSPEWWSAASSFSPLWPFSCFLPFLGFLFAIFLFPSPQGS